MNLNFHDVHYRSGTHKYTWGGYNKGIIIKIKIDYFDYNEKLSTSDIFCTLLIFQGYAWICCCKIWFFNIYIFHSNFFSLLLLLLFAIRSVFFVSVLELVAWHTCATFSIHTAYELCLFIRVMLLSVVVMRAFQNFLSIEWVFDTNYSRWNWKQQKYWNWLNWKTIKQ